MMLLTNNLVLSYTHIGHVTEPDIFSDTGEWQVSLHYDCGVSLVLLNMAVKPTSEHTNTHAQAKGAFTNDVI